MLHPFDGIIIPSTTPAEPTSATNAGDVSCAQPGISRRSLLGGLLASVAGAAGLFGGRAQALEPSGGQSMGTGQATPQHFPGRDGIVTTYALGEEGSWYPPGQPRPPHHQPRPPVYTTQAVGEEGGWWGRPPHWYNRQPQYPRYPRHPGHSRRGTGG